VREKAVGVIVVVVVVASFFCFVCLDLQRVEKS